MKGHNPKWSEIPDDSYRELIVGEYASERTNALLNLIKYETYL